MCECVHMCNQAFPSGIAAEIKRLINKTLAKEAIHNVLVIDSNPVLCPQAQKTFLSFTPSSTCFFSMRFDMFVNN